MDLYALSKFLHVLAAILWLGGGTALILLGILADRAKNDDEFLAVAISITKIAPRVFVPGTVIVLVTGLLMVWAGGLAWDAWIVVGLFGVLATGGIGAKVLSPLAEKVVKLSAMEGRKSDALTLGRRLISIAKADYVLQFAIVFLMVVKPDWDDVAMLLLLAVIVITGVTYFARSAPPAPA